MKTVLTTTSKLSNALLATYGQPVGGLLAFGLGVATFVVPDLQKGLGTQLGIALIIAGLAVFHVTVSNIAG